MSVRYHTAATSQRTGELQRRDGKQAANWKIAMDRGTATVDRGTPTSYHDEDRSGNNKQDPSNRKIARADPHKQDKLKQKQIHPTQARQDQTQAAPSNTSNSIPNKRKQSNRVRGGRRTWKQLERRNKCGEPGNRSGERRNRVRRNQATNASGAPRQERARNQAQEPGGAPKKTRGAANGSTGAATREQG
jgi:hypothetical protein